MFKCTKGSPNPLDSGGGSGPKCEGFRGLGVSGIFGCFFSLPFRCTEVEVSQWLDYEHIKQKL